MSGLAQYYNFSDKLIHLINNMKLPMQTISLRYSTEKLA
jgi:hypothetical protein